MAGILIENGDVVMIHGKIFDCKGCGLGGKLAFFRRPDGSPLYVTREKAYDLSKTGDLTVVDPNDFDVRPANSPSYIFTLEELPATERRDAYDRLAYVKAIDEFRSKGGKLVDHEMKPVLKKVFRKLSQQAETHDLETPKKPISPRSARRWYKRWREMGKNPYGVVRERRGNGHSHFAPDVQLLIDEVIGEHYLNGQRLSVAAVHKILVNNIVNLNVNRRKNGGSEVSVPSYDALRIQIKKIDQYERDKARFGARYAHSANRAYKASPVTTRHLERVQMDHTLIDVYCDFGEKVLIRPWLTLAVDVHSKAILGYYLSESSPTAQSVMNCLRVAILPKDTEKLGGESSWVWPMCGIPEEISVDNGWDFRGYDLKYACSELGINLDICPPRRPYYKAEVERMFGQINNGVFQSCPGRVHKREPDQLKADGLFIRFEELNYRIMEWITRTLHRTPNKMGFTPNEIWEMSERLHGKAA